MAKRSIDTWQDIISAERLAAERSGAEPRHIPPSGRDAGRDRLSEAHLKHEPERDRVWDARPALGEIWTHGRQGRVDSVAAPARQVRRPRD